MVTIAAEYRLFIETYKQLGDKYVTVHDVVDNSSITALRNKAVSDNTPPVAWWQSTPGSSNGNLYVYTGDVHHYSKLCRVVVHTCTVHVSSIVDCACCSCKVGCVHKKLALWHLAQVMQKVNIVQTTEVARSPADAAISTDKYRISDDRNVQ